MILNSHTPVPPFSMHHPGVVNNTKPLMAKQDNSNLTVFSHQGAWVNNRDGLVFSSNPSTGQPFLTAPMSSYQPNNQIGGNPWALTEMTEDQALLQMAVCPT